MKFDNIRGGWLNAAQPFFNVYKKPTHQKVLQLKGLMENYTTVLLDMQVELDDNCNITQGKLYF